MVRHLPEAGWLASAVVAPILFNSYSVSTFEPDKVLLLCSIAALAACGLLINALDPGESLKIAPVLRLRSPLVIWGIALTLAYLLSTAVSQVPGVSFWGEYFRLEGAHAWLGYQIVFLSIALCLRFEDQAERLITVLIAGSAVTALYGLLQAASLDPIEWEAGHLDKRIFSMAGQPVFFAAGLIMIVPLTAARLLAAFSPAARGGGARSEQRSRRSRTWKKTYYGGIFGLQLAGIVLAGSRGPFLGLLVGTGFFCLILAQVRNARRLKAGLLAGGLVCIAFLGLLNLPGRIPGRNQTDHSIWRLGRILEADRGSGRARTLVWESAATLLQADPVRELVGYGPGSLYDLLSRYYPVQLAHIESNARYDRTHNGVFDVLVTTGLVGLVTETGVYLAFFYLLLSRLGFLFERADKATFFLLCLGGGLLGSCVPRLLDGSFRFSALGLTAGMVLGLLSYLLQYEFRGKRPPGGLPHRLEFLLAALIASGVAHWVELQFGVAVATTRVYFWMIAGLTAALTGPALSVRSIEPVVKPGEPRGRIPERASRKKRMELPRAGDLDTVVLGSLMGLVLILLTFGFYTPSLGESKGDRMLLALAGSWLLLSPLVLLPPQRGLTQGGSRGTLRRLCILSLGLWLGYLALHVPLVRGIPGWTALAPAQVMTRADRTILAVGLLYLAVLGTVWILAYFLSRQDACNAPASARRTTVWGGLTLVAFGWIMGINLKAAGADVYCKEGLLHEGAGRLGDAAKLFERAVRLEPRQASYFLNLGRVYRELGLKAEENLPLRERYFSEAVRVLEQSKTINPASSEPYRYLLSVHYSWLASMQGESEKRRHWTDAERNYAGAVERSPNDVRLRNGWAMMLLEQGQFADALQVLRSSMEKDPKFGGTFLARARVYRALGKKNEALLDYESALRLNPKLDEAKREKESLAGSVSQSGERR